MRHCIIADIAGQYKALVQLVQKMPEGEVISLGDMVDRGPDSQRVLDFFMKEGRRAVLGNHEHIMVDNLTNGGFYDPIVWIKNGGKMTLQSFPKYGEVPQKYIDWINQLPKYLEIDDCLISHSFPMYYDAVEDFNDLGYSYYHKQEATIIWNRSYPRRRDEYRLQVAGHNSMWKIRRFCDDKGEFAICLDDSRSKRLTGMVLETGEIFQQDFIE